MSSLNEKAFAGEPSTNTRKVEMFHANTDSDSKNRILKEFTNTAGNLKVIVSTVAFGMGVNITDIDIVLHWGLPSSVLSYWQEVGRCARDGRQGYAICYAYKRSYSKLGEDDELRKVLKECNRVTILDNFLLVGMDKKSLEEISDKEDCEEICDNICGCMKCKCCIVCQRQCKCKAKVTDPLKHF